MIEAAETQLNMRGTFDESEAKALLAKNQKEELDTHLAACELISAQQKEELEAALTSCGYRYKHTTWKLAILIHHMAKGDGILRRSAKWLDADPHFKAKERSIREARQKLFEDGIIDIIELKSLDGGADLKAMKLNRTNVRKLAAGESVKVDADQNLQGASHPARQGASHPARHPANSESLYRTINQLPPLPPTNFQLDQSAVAAVEILNSNSGLSKRESTRIVLEHGIDPETAADAVATFKANASLRSPATIAYYFDNREWPADNVKEITAAETHARTVRAAYTRLYDMTGKDERFDGCDDEVRRNAVSVIMDKEFGDQWRPHVEAIA